MAESFIFYQSFWNALKRFPPDDMAESINAIAEYALNEKEPDNLGLLAETFFTMAKPQIDANVKRKNDGARGGRPKTSGYESEKPVVSDLKTSGYACEKPNVNVNDNVKVKDNVNKQYCVRFEQIWKAYPRKREKMAAYKAYKARLSEGFSEDELETAVKRYAEECKKKNTEDRYIKHCATFFGPNKPFADYLGDYVPDCAKPKKNIDNRFKNFDERDTDYAEMVWAEMMKKKAKGGIEKENERKPDS